LDAKSAIFLTAAWLLRICEKNHHFILGQRSIAAVDDEDDAHSFVGQILETSKKGNH
jgi:hypothetical protein